MAMTGTLRWGEQVHQVSGSSGHVDRQWFPKYAGGGGSGGDPRARSHEWRTINFDNGVDLSIWRQFDRTNNNVLQPFTGITVSYPDSAMAPECAEDVEVTVSSYVRWPESMRPLVRPLPRPGTCPIVTGSPVPHWDSTSPASRWWRRRRTVCRSNTWKAPTVTAGRCRDNR